MVDISAVRAIDFHTHAQAPRGCHADDRAGKWLAAFLAAFKDAAFRDEVRPHILNENAMGLLKFEGAV